MRSRTILATLVMAALCGCSGEQPAPPSPKPVRNPKIPVGVSYPITRDEDAFIGTKRLVDVKLNQPVSKEVLREIALEIKGSEKKQYQYTMIFYYLPDSGEKLWASTHFNPTLNVTIMGEMLGLDR